MMGLVWNDQHTDVAKSLSGKRLYACDAPDCNVRRVPWSSRWVWYGSYKDLDEDPASILTFCSEECRAAAKFVMQTQELKARNG
ncbi:hypothetical protein [Maritalea porphyrae]|uniref:hypothetical protein n=1 Tax=Maritalea porphyrae TaxID=880732 RepID=UPI0022AFA56F|nr:hypothetical protein [Maritalea porphyrae]MCZ4270941.1 hypothetical protein [Maritalea porphyrae]